MVVGLVSRTASQAGKVATRQVARRKMTSEVMKEPEKYNLPDVDATFMNPYKVIGHLSFNLTTTTGTRSDSVACMCNNVVYMNTHSLCTH